MPKVVIWVGGLLVVVGAVFATIRVLMRDDAPDKDDSTAAPVAAALDASVAAPPTAVDAAPSRPEPVEPATDIITLKIKTTHVKESYIRRSGVFRSDRATLTHFLTRRGDILTWVTITYDPVYLSEPLIRSTEYRLALNQLVPPYPCTVVAEVDRPRGGAA